MVGESCGFGILAYPKPRNFKRYIISFEKNSKGFSPPHSFLKNI